MRNIILVSTTHLTPKEEIIKIIKKEKPDIIGVELCKTRLDIMVLNQTQKASSTDESLVGKISNAIKKKAKEEKVEYGSDMISASRYALDNKIPLLLLDRDAVEINYLMNKIPQNEQQGFMNELARFQEQTLKEATKMKDTEILNNLKTNYPIAFELLVTSRELIILTNILMAKLKNPKKKILVFLGKGHVKSIGGKLK